MARESIAVGAKPLPVSPEGQELTALDDEGTVLRTRFAGIGGYHPALAAKTLELAETPEYARQRVRSMGGTKLYGLHEWDCSEADLIDARAAWFTTSTPTAAGRPASPWPGTSTGKYSPAPCSKP